MPLGTLGASWVAGVFGQHHPGDGIPCRLKIEQQRNNGMSVRRHGQLALAGFGQTPEARHDGTHQLADERQQLFALRRREIATLIGERGHQGVGAADGFAKPRQVIPDGQVVNELLRGVPSPLGCGEHLGNGSELEIRTEALDHLLALCA